MINNNLKYGISRPGISNDYLQLCGVHQDEKGDLIIPYRTITGEPVIDGKIPFSRKRLKVPSGKKKYHQDAGTSVHAWIPPNLSELYHNNPKTLYLTEDEFKAMALCELGYFMIGLSGFYPVVKESIVDGLQSVIDEFEIDKFYFIGDSDTALNYQFADAVFKLKEKLPDIEICLPRIPIDGPGKGIDDCKEALGDSFGTWFDGIVDSAIKIDSDSIVSDVFIQIFEQQTQALKQLDRKSKRNAMNKAIRSCSYISDILGLKALESLIVSTFNIGIHDFRNAVKTAKKESAKKRSTINLSSFLEEVAKKSCEPFKIKECEGTEIPVAINEGFLAQLHADSKLLIHEPKNDRFYQYNDDTGLWRSQTPDVAKYGVEKTAKLLLEELNLPDLRSTLTNRFQNNVVELTKGRLQENRSFENKPKGYIHLANGMLNIESGDLCAFDSSYYSRNQIPVNYEPGATCEQFSQFLGNALDDDSIHTIQRHLGQVLLGDNLTQTLLILEGVQGTGKSTLAQIYRLLNGPSNCYQLRIKQLQERFELFNYIDKTLLVASDVRGNFLNTHGAEMIKALTGGDPMNAERKNGHEHIEIEGRFNILITTNSRLRVRLDGDAGAYRRRLNIVSFPGPMVSKRIPNFAEYLIKNEGPGILNFAIEGAYLLLDDIKSGKGFIRTDDQLKRVDALLAESDSLRHFLKTRVTRSKDSFLTNDELADAYFEYTDEMGWTPLKRGQFDRQLKDLMSEIHRSSQDRHQKQRRYMNAALLEVQGYGDQ